ncbi:MAG: YciI family protein [Pseudomonadota bacterium]
MKFAVLFEDHSGAGSELRFKYLDAHLAFLVRNSSVIDAAGALKESDNSHAGGLWIVEAENREIVRNLVEEDPFWLVGLRKTVQILFWQRDFSNGYHVVEI